MSRALLLRALRQSYQPCTRTIRTISRPQVSQASQLRYASHTPSLVRWASSKSMADEKIEEITELFATAKDEFEIAMEETEKGTVYAEDDRTAAKEELEKVQQAYRTIVEGTDKELADEVKRRIGHRIRELENGVARMEELAQEHD